MRIFFVIFLTAVVTVHAQVPQVPHKMEFAGMTLIIRDDARKEIQKDVNALTQSPRHHNIKVERAKTYFPLIEKVFEEERVPDDFKYLVLQESALIADAVSVSNAVGFWQFKDFTAVEMGLRVDKEIDERLNIVSSTRAAARYIKKNNFYFNNWIFALQAYQMGAGGAMKSLKDHQSGAKQMEITSSTYWYVKKYLAHKVAFEDAVKGMGQIRVLPYENRSKKSLADIAQEVSVDEAELKLYNKWVKSGRIPDDRSYTILIPATGTTEPKLPESAVASTQVIPASVPEPVAARAEQIKVNGIKALRSVAGETPAKFAARAGVSISDFVKWNDINRNAPILPDQYYLLGKKRTRGTETYHKVSQGETLWQISQQYGVQIKKLRRYNRMSTQEEVVPGETLWLASKKPKDSDAATPEPGEIMEVNNGETFAWSSDGDQPIASVSKKVATPAAAETTSVTTQEANIATSLSVDSAKNTVDSSKTIQPGSDTKVVITDSVVRSQSVVIVSGKNKQHTVKAGETLYGIANEYQVGVMDIVRWNDLNLQAGIKPGQVLKLSESQPVITDEQPTLAKKQFEHEVKTTDTLYSIARKYGVTIKELMQWNDKKDFTLAIGEKLRIQER
jgi:membrane-bound lytic murein transglycosylase D